MLDENTPQKLPFNEFMTISNNDPIAVPHSNNFAKNLNTLSFIKINYL